MGKLAGLAAICLISSVFSSGCVSMSRSDQMMYTQIKDAGLDAHAGDTKSPVAAGALNVLPGIGNFYLAVGTGQGPQVLYGVLNLLCWPVSVVWGVPEAAIDANTINKLETVDYYRFDPKGRAEFAAATSKESQQPANLETEKMATAHKQRDK